MNVDINSNYLTNSFAAAKRFAGDVLSRLHSSIEQKPWGSYKSGYGSVPEAVRYVSRAPADIVAATGLDVLTNATRQKVWKYTNLHRVMGDVGQRVAPKLGLESTLAGAVVSAAVPVGLGILSGQTGSLLGGLRPPGYKAVAPVSKEEDPTGRKTQSPILEAAMRYGLGQRSQLLPYQEFKKERPDVLPSTYVDYKRYQGMRPEAGKLVKVDSKGQSFAVLGGVVKGTAKGLNDPEIRVKGVPITASAALGTALGLGAVKGLASTLNPETTFGPAIKELQRKVADAATLAAQQQNAGVAQSVYTTDLANKQALLSAAKKARYKSLSPVAQQFQKLGSLKDPALITAGIATAGLVAHATKKLFEKSTERRLKKENPVEYLKQKHGSLEQASAALNQPTARSWQQLVPYV